MCQVRMFARQQSPLHILKKNCFMVSIHKERDRNCDDKKENLSWLCELKDYLSYFFCLQNKEYCSGNCFKINVQWYECDSKKIDA